MFIGQGCIDFSSTLKRAPVRRSLRTRALSFSKAPAEDVLSCNQGRLASLLTLVAPRKPRESLRSQRAVRRFQARASWALEMSRRPLLRLEYSFSMAPRLPQTGGGRNCA